MSHLGLGVFTQSNILLMGLLSEGMIWPQKLKGLFHSYILDICIFSFIDFIQTYTEPRCDGCCENLKPDRSELALKVHSRRRLIYICYID